MHTSKIRFSAALVAVLAAVSGTADDARTQKAVTNQQAVTNPPVVTTVALECSLKSTGCGWGACGYDVMATNTSAIDLPPGYKVRAAVTHKAVNLSSPTSPGQVTTSTLEKVVPRGGLPKGRSFDVGEYTVGKNKPGPSSCQANAGP